MKQNPYAAPNSNSPADARPIREVHRSLLWEWEKLRPLYNLITAACIYVVTFPAHPRLLQEPKFWRTSAVLMIIVNVCYVVGPVAEGFLCQNGKRSKTSRRILFALASAFALVLSIAAVASELYPGI